MFNKNGLLTGMVLKYGNFSRLKNYCVFETVAL